MTTVHLMLNEVERKWRDEVRRDFPLRSNTPVVRRLPSNGKDWEFSTDLKKIYAAIGNSDGLRKKFETIIAQHWDAKPEDLMRDTLHYLLFHELYHPLEAPFSVSGDDNDNKHIHQAIRRGIIKAEPNLSPLEQVVKVQASQNTVKDFILDNRFYLDNQRKGYVREDIIPTWDVLEVQDISARTDLFTITRFLYGVLYGPVSTHSFFEEKAGKKGAKVAEQALAALLEKPVSLPKEEGFVGKVKSLFSSKQEEQNLAEYTRAIRETFAPRDNTRYQAIERFMAVLGPYIKKGMPEGRPHLHGEGTGASPQTILQDLLDDMNPQEQAQFLQGLGHENQQALQQAASGMQPNVSNLENSSSVDEMKNLDLLATHEFYLRNHPKVAIVGGKKVGESVVVGKREYWNLKRSTVLTEHELHKLNLQRIDVLQRRTRLPWLIDMGNGSYRLNEYELKQKNLKDIVYVDAQIDVPDTVEFYLDSSGSMFNGTHGTFTVNDGHRWDMLCHVFYGFVDALQQGGKKVGKKSKMRIHNFAEKYTVTSPYITPDTFLRGDLSPLQILFKPNNGYDGTNLYIDNSSNNAGKTAYVIVTDGAISDTDREARRMKELARNPSNHVVLFEIGGTYSLGEAVKKDPSIIYHPVHDKEKMLQAGLEVLLSK